MKKLELEDDCFSGRQRGKDQEKCSHNAAPLSPQVLSVSNGRLHCISILCGGRSADSRGIGIASTFLKTPRLRKTQLAKVTQLLYGGTGI